MLRSHRLSLLPLLLLVLSACSTLGVAPAQSFDQKLAYAYATHTAVLTTATNALSAGTIKSADAEQVLKLADESRALLDGAKAVSSTDPTMAGNKLALAASILTQLQSYLQARGVK